MKKIRTALLGAAALSAWTGLSYGAPAASFSIQEAGASESTACACTCAACVAKHGSKPKLERIAPATGVDIGAEVARVLAEGLEVQEEASVAELGADDLSVEDIIQGLEELAMTGVGRGYMGIGLGELTTVGPVQPDGPADTAGLQEGDVITAIDEMPVETAEDLIAMVIEAKVGDTVTVEFEREGEEHVIDIVLAPLIVPSGSPSSILGSAGEGLPVSAEDFTGPAPVVESGPARPAESVGIVLPTKVEALQELGYGGVEELAPQDVPPNAPIDVAPEPEVSATAEPVGMGLTDPLPAGYIEILTRRERRPANTSDTMAGELRDLTRQVAELSALVAELRAEMDRRSMN